ncbi:TetR/AcrR family transcriptional regulator [Phytohabitans rumicis]|uniref:Tetracyclin repressor-like C-terminal domain-containing protein n=2 Tax=Phytohabitans rumicis TaxID=1076125 RepID=A0A6V8LAQ8_9ACTN|nr:hypothetical protein [Phytohabitans rumicis]GFJ91629.1 hypothetical protein Prum_052710 [Phytohabitans rumicis]
MVPYRARLSASLTDQKVAEAMHDDFVAAFFGRLATEVSPDQPELRASLAASQVIGLAVSRYLVEEPTLVACSREELIRMLGRTIQHYLTADLAPAAA